MIKRTQLLLGFRSAVALFALFVVGTGRAATTEEQQSVDELRNTVINLLNSLVERGVLTREQAEQLVKSAQAKAAADAAAKAAQEQQQKKEEQGAIRVPYVPQIVKDEISKEVLAEVKPSVTKEVVREISSPGALQSALPEWMRRMQWYADARVRAEGDLFAKDNAVSAYLDFNQINSKGGIGQAGDLALLNTTEDRDRLRLRFRFGFDADLGSGWSTGMRVATGAGEIFISTNQTLGTYGARYQVALDEGYIRWSGHSSTDRQLFSIYGGRFANPYLSTDLVWYNDLTFEGIASDYRFNLSGDNAHRKDIVITIGGFPLSNYSIFDSNPFGENKWLAAGQLGTDLHFDDALRWRVGAAFYDYIHTVGIRNSLNSNLYDWTAPALFQKGNTVFNIRNSSDPTQYLFALASAFRIVDATTVVDWHALPNYMVSLTFEGVKNVGFDGAAVAARTGFDVPARTLGYRGDVSFGSAVPDRSGAWRMALGYRYLQRDAVIDAFNDQDFHLGGTDAKGYTVGFDYSFTPHAWARVRYMSANAIDGPPLGIDVVQVDINTQF